MKNSSKSFSRITKKRIGKPDKWKCWQGQKIKEANWFILCRTVSDGSDHGNIWLENGVDGKVVYIHMKKNIHALGVDEDIYFLYLHRAFSKDG